jgi:hypothetical protein
MLEEKSVSWAWNGTCLQSHTGEAEAGRLPVGDQPGQYSETLL